MKATEVFECSFCKKIYRTEGECITHEDQCCLNPVKKNCYTCSNVTYKTYLQEEIVSWVMQPMCKLCVDINDERVENCEQYCYNPDEGDGKRIFEAARKYDVNGDLLKEKYDCTLWSH